MARQPGPGVDASGTPVVDPTQNVLDLVQAAIQRQDDLREADGEKLQAESIHLRELMALRSEYEDRLRKAETARIDAIRAVDVGAVQRATEVAAVQAETLRSQVATSAEALRVAWAASLEPIQKDIADLRKTQYEQAGQKAQVGESRLNYGAILGGISVVLVLVFGIATMLMSN